MTKKADFINDLTFNKEGLIPAIAQQYDSGEVLTLAWMNKLAIEKTLKSKKVFYWSRSRGKLWQKGESSGQTQKLVSMQVDCDLDAILLKVDQKGVACHTGRRSCFFYSVSGKKLKENQKQLVKPEKLYGKKGKK